MTNQKMFIRDTSNIDMGWSVCTAAGWAFYLPERAIPPTVILFNRTGTQYIWYPKTGKIVTPNKNEGRNSAIGTASTWDELIHILTAHIAGV